MLRLSKLKKFSNDNLKLLYENSLQERQRKARKNLYDYISVNVSIGGGKEEYKINVNKNKTTYRDLAMHISYLQANNSLVALHRNDNLVRDEKNEDLLEMSEEECLEKDDEDVEFETAVRGMNEVVTGWVVWPYF